MGTLLGLHPTFWWVITLVVAIPLLITSLVYWIKMSLFLSKIKRINAAAAEKKKQQFRAYSYSPYPYSHETFRAQYF